MPTVGVEAGVLLGALPGRSEQFSTPKQVPGGGAPGSWQHRARVPHVGWQSEAGVKGGGGGGGGFAGSQSMPAVNEYSENGGDPGTNCRQRMRQR